ncbi:MAG: hypothetical protein IJS94_01225, partial [Clostridia bacterium]|nr:hypothetical protein [Clostridia bacterium]
MKKRILCLFLCLSLLAVLVPAGTFSISTSAAGSSYLVDNFDGLKSMFSYNTSETEPLYLKLKNDISKTITEPTELATAGRDVVLDLGGYTLSFTDKGSDPSTPINGKNGSITIMDSKRYDESTGRWISGKIEYLYTQPERGTEVMTGDIIVKGGKIVNKTHDGAFPINYNSAYTSSTTGGYIKMYGGTLEADYPIFLQYVKGSVIYDGTLNIKWNAGIRIWKYNYTSVFSAEELPKVYNCKMFNCSTDATVHAFETSVTTDYLKLYTMEHALQTLGSSMFGEGAEAYIDGIRYEDVTKKFELGGSPSYEISGPYFKSHYEVFIPETIDKIDLSIADPEPGELMPYDAYVPANAGYSVVNDYITGNSGYRNGVQWTSGYSYNDIYDFGSSFEAGKSYASFIMVVPVKPKYSFADVDKISATINGKKALVYENNGAYIVYRSFDVQKKTVDSIEIKVTEPKAGALPSYAATIPEDTGYAIQTSSFTNGVSWMNESGAALASGYKFEKNKKYTVLVMLKLTDSQKYQFEDSTKINATINGKKATVIPYSPTSYGITYQFDLSTVISEIEITVPNTKAGGKAEWSASVPENADYTVENKSAYLTANGVTWYNENNTTVAPGKNLTFEAGKTYKVTVSIEVADKDNYQFAAEGNVTAKVNGNTAEVHVTSDSKCLVIYTFTAKKVINSVDVTIAEPKSGEQLSYVATVPDGVDYEMYPFTSDPSINL